MTVNDTFYRDNINATKTFQWVPARGDIAQVQLLPNGQVTGSDEVNGWNLRWLQGLFIQLHLTKDDESVAMLRLEATGEWKGRDRQNGYCTLRPRQDMRAHWADIQKKPLGKEKWQDQLARYHWKSGTVDWDKAKTVVKRQALSMNTPTAIILIGYDRPDYYEKTVRSIAQDPTAQTLSVYAYLDYPKGKRAIQAEHVAITHKYFPHAEIHLRQRNFGCGRNIINARSDVFDRGHEQAFLFEDDCVVSSNYVSLMLRLMRWARNNYDNVGAVQGWIPCLHKEEDKRKRLHFVEGTFVNWWGYLIHRDAWETIKPLMTLFRDTFLLGDYGERPHHIIRSFVDEYKQSTAVENPSGRLYPVTLTWHKRRQEHLANIPAGQDGMTQMGFALNNIVRLTTQVNRARYIGAKGIHMSPMRYRLAGYQNVKLHEFAEDAKLSKFRPGNEWNPPSIMDGLVMARA